MSIGKNDDEYDYIYDYLDNKGVKIRGINGTLSGEIENYVHIPKMTQSKVPETLDEIEQQKLFDELQKFTKEDIENENPKYLEIKNKLVESNMPLANWIATTWIGIRNLPIPEEIKKTCQIIW